MLLYRNSDGHFSSTQALAEKRKREGGGTFEQIEVPSVGRQQLADFLNYLVGVTRDDFIDAATDNAERLEAAVERVSAPTPISQNVALQYEADAIVEFILDRAKVHQCENIFAALGTRFGEFAKERRD